MVGGGVSGLLGEVAMRIGGGEFVKLFSRGAARWGPCDLAGVGV